MQILSLEDILNIMKKRVFISAIYTASLIVGLMLVAGSADAQLRLPRPSQAASVKQTVGVTDITITYNRPGVKGRTIWGDAPKDAYAKGESTLDDQNRRPEGMPIVPNGHVWRTGANEATRFEVTDDVYINGQKLPAGSYSLHTIPNKDEWTIVFNSEANQWGSFNYSEAKDTLRVQAKPEWADASQEWLSFTIDPDKANTAIVNIRWEKLRVPFTVEVRDMNALVLSKAKAAVAAAKSDDWQTPFNAANFAKQNKADAEASQWYERSLKAIDVQVAAKPNFMNLARRASILFAMGKKDEGVSAAEKAIAQGKAEKADTSALEKRVADIKDGKM